MLPPPSAVGRRPSWLLVPAAGLLALAAPLAVGGAPPAAQLLLSSAALLLLFVYAIMRGDSGLRPVPFFGVALLALGVTLFQLVPLPAFLVGLLSPLARALRDEAASGARFMPLTLDVPATWLALMRGLACASLLLVVGGVIESARRARQLLAMVAGACLLVALVALAQRAADVQSILGIYRPRSQPGFGVYGTFVDVNHAASLLAFGTLIAVGLAVEMRGVARVVAGAAAALMIVALFVTMSRSGVMGLAAGGFLLVALLTARATSLPRALAVATITIIVAAGLTLYGSAGMRARLTGHAGELVHNQKTRGWIDGMRMAADYRWTGVGRGAFESPVSAYREHDEGVRLVYPESIVVQATSEWGFPATLALLALALAAVRRYGPAIARATPGVIGAASAVVAVLVHDLGDFSLELPGVAFPAAIALGVVAGRLAAGERRRGPRGERIPPRAWLPLWTAAALALLAAGVSSAHTLDADYQRLHDAAARGEFDERALQAAIARHPADEYMELLAAQRSMRLGSPPDALHHLNRALRLHPGDAQAHLLTARLLVALKRPSQAALEYRLGNDGAVPANLDELVRELGGHVVETVPQTPASLVQLAYALYGRGHRAEGDAVARQAVVVSDGQIAMLTARVQLALQFEALPALALAARELLADADSVEAIALAARALARAGAAAESRAAIDAGLKLHANDATLILTGAELRLGAGDLVGARQVLARSARASLSLTERQHAEELLAEIAEKSGDPAAAAVARARARLIANQLRDMTFAGKRN